VVELDGGPQPPFLTVPLEPNGYLLKPGKFALACTAEAIQVGPHLICSLDGRSTVARLGLFVHCSSTTLDNVVSNSRTIVLELYNAGPYTIRLKPGAPIGQFQFTKLIGEISVLDQPQYAGQNGPVTPEIAFEREQVGTIAAPPFGFDHAPEGYVCPFCQIVAGLASNYTSTQDVVLRGKLVTAFVASHWWPENPGGVVIASNMHIENLYTIPSNVGAAVFEASRLIAIAMKDAYQCEGVSTRQHNEPAGGQDVWHFHSHVFPRMPGDRLYERDREKSLAPIREKSRRAALLRSSLAQFENELFSSA
jgi:histidine triad (HIT) family protein